jgi:hypothetical protein
MKLIIFILGSTVTLMLFLALLFSGVGYAEEYTTDQIVMAIFRAEGGTKASVPYGIMYKGCGWDDVDYCHKIAVNTVNNTRKRWIKAGQPKPFLEYLRDRYAPLSDHHLNSHWLKNVSYFLTKQNR